MGILLKKRFSDKVTITQTNVDDSQALYCTCRSHNHRNWETDHCFTDVISFNLLHFYSSMVLLTGVALRYFFWQCSPYVFKARWTAWLNSLENCCCLALKPNILPNRSLRWDLEQGISKTKSLNKVDESLSGVLICVFSCKLLIIKVIYSGVFIQDSSSRIKMW